MTSSAELLLEGPRGRRLCLELAMELDQDVRSAALGLAHDLDSGKGTSRVHLTSSSTGPGVAEPPVPSLDELVDSLAALKLSGLDAPSLQLALQCAVDNARYWQPPDGEDVLAALPEITSALSRIAGQVVTAPSAQWWREPRGVEQWAMDWRVADDPAPLPKNPGKTLAEWAEKTRLEEIQAERERPGDPSANWGGTWWSIPHGVIQTVGTVPAGLSLVEDSLGWEHATVIPVRGIGRTLEIRTAEEWLALCRCYPIDVTASRRHDWFRTTGRHGRWVIPDWEQVAAEWDAVHLTVLGYLSAAGRALAVDADTGSVIAGWDPDSTIWLTDVAREWEGPREAWQRDSNSDQWIRRR